MCILVHIKLAWWTFCWYKYKKSAVLWRLRPSDSCYLYLRQPCTPCFVFVYLFVQTSVNFTLTVACQYKPSSSCLWIHLLIIFLIKIMSKLIDNLLGLQNITKIHCVLEPDVTSSNVLLCLQSGTTKHSTYYDRKPTKKISKLSHSSWKNMLVIKLLRQLTIYYVCQDVSGCWLRARPNRTTSVLNLINDRNLSLGDN